MIRRLLANVAWQLVTLLSLGTLLIVGGAASNGATRDAVQSVGEALLVTALVGGAVDVRARARFAREIGRGAILALFGRNAPAAYVDAVEKFLTQPRLVVRIDWFVTFAWADERHETLDVTVVRRANAVNISDRPSPLTPVVGLTASVGGFQTELRSYDVQSGDTTVHLTWPELRRAVERVPESDDVVVRVTKIRATRAEIAPGEKYTVGMEVAHRLPSAGTLPLVASSPVMERHLTLDGPALTDLAVALYDGVRYVRVSPRADGRRVWTDDAVMFPGQMLVLSWRPESVAQ